MIIRHDFLKKGQHYDPLTIRRNVGKPVVVFVTGNLLLLASIRLHPPDLHGFRCGLS
jgi:hypothetical protein